ncbi:hypothetical protein [Rheinheimera gaetbuli]
MRFCFKLLSILFFSLFLSGCGGSSSADEVVELKSAEIHGFDLSSLIVGMESTGTVAYSSTAGSESVTVKLTAVPTNSSLLNKTFSGRAFSLSFDAVGIYVIEVTVSDRAGVIAKEFELNISNNNPQARVSGRDKTNLFAEFELSAADSNDIDGHTLNYHWSLLTKPDGSGLNEHLGSDSDLIFHPDAKGNYAVKLTVDDGFGGESEEVFNFIVGAFTFQRVVFNVVDAVYNAALDKIVVVSDDKKLYLYSPQSHNTEVISLAYQGTSVSVLADGSKAAVGHNGKISYVDLSSLSVEQVYSISTDVFDLEIAPNGYVYAMPRTDQWERLRAINLANGEEIQQPGNSIRAGTVIKMHPSQQYIYGADRGLSPSDIEKYDIRAGAPAYLYDSPYHGDYAMCGDLWLSQDGLRIFTRCGNVFRASEVREQDMTYNGRLATQDGIAALSHHQNSVVFVDNSSPNYLNYYSYETLEALDSEELPIAIVNDEPYQTNAHFVFHRANGSVLALVKVDDNSGLLYSYGLAYTPNGIEQRNLNPVAIIDENKYVGINELTEISAGLSFDPEDAELTYSWQMLSKPEGSIASLSTVDDVTTAFTPDLKGSYQIRVKVNDGVNDSSYATATIIAEDPQDKQLVELGFDVTASAFSEQLNKVIFIASNPNQLILFDIENSSFETIDLAGSSSVLELSLSGTRAAVGFANSVAIVDLVTKQVTATYSVASDIIDLVLPDNGYLYVFPKTRQWANITTINLATGEEMTHIGNSIYAGTLADLHPSGDYIYGADNGLSPSDIELYNISGGNARYVYDSPYHGDYDMCGNIWLAEDGKNLFTPCGNVFKANPGQADDMQYVSKLTITGAIKAISQKADEIALINTGAWWYHGDAEIGHVIYFYDYPGLSQVRSLEIPTTKINDTEFKNYGVNLFHNSAGNKIITLVKIDPEAGKLREYSLFIYSK